MRLRLLALVLLATPLASAADLAEARQLFQDRRVPEAAVLLEKIIATEPANVEALGLLGQCDLRMQKPDAAVAHLDRAVTLAPANAVIEAQYGFACLVAAGKSLSFSLAQKGRTALEKAIELNPDALDAREGLIQFYSQAPGIAGGNMDKAYAQAKEIAQRDATRGFVITISLKLREKAYADAFVLCEAALQRKADDYVALFELGRTAATSGRNLDRGIATLQQCLTLAPPPRYAGHAAAQYRLGLLQQAKGDQAAARAAFEAALQLEPNNRQVTAALAKLK